MQIDLNNTTTKPMENKKQTAVEWLQEQFKRQRFIEHIDFEQAKAMEKEQIIEAVNYGCSDWGSWKDAEAYYNKNFNK